MDTLRESALRAQLLYRRERLKEAIPAGRDFEKLVHLLHEVEAALDRIDAGSYGICQVCNEPIEEEHLRADPLVRICLAHLSDEQQRSIERDLQLASLIQSQLLPEQHAQVDGWEVCYHYEPLGPVSGDYCDLIKPKAEGGDTYFLFGDVSGKGVAASLLMSQLHAIFRSLIGVDLPLIRLVERANRLFSESTLATHFATLVCGRASSSGEIEVCNAGHCPPLIVRDGEVTSIESTGLPVGMFYSGQYELKKIKLEEGDTLLLYTDGLTETRNSSNVEYGEERLSALLARHKTLLPHDLINTCLADLTTFRASAPKVDDLTIMALRRVK